MRAAVIMASGASVAWSRSYGAPMRRNVGAERASSVAPRGRALAFSIRSVQSQRPRSCARLLVRHVSGAGVSAWV